MGKADPLKLVQSLVAGRVTVYLFCVVFATASSFGCTDKNPAADILFATDAAHLSNADQTAIAAIIVSMFAVSADGQRLEHPDCGDVIPVTEVVDLNGDDDYEVFITWGNACTSGGAGRSLGLFTPNEEGGFDQHFGFPAFSWTALDTSDNGWPDIRIDGPGFCHPVWTWVSDAYEFKCNLPESAGGCESRRDVCKTAAASTK